MSRKTSLKMADLTRRLINEMGCFGSLPFLVFFLIFIFLTEPIKIPMGCFIALAVGIITVLTIRFCYHRIRPENKKRGRIKFESIVHRLDDASFPSMHSMRVSIIAYVLYLMNPVLVYAGAAISLATFFSRKYTKRHYWSDIIVGCLLGLVIAYSVFLII